LFIVWLLRDYVFTNTIHAAMF